jgi:HEAT repeat protein
VFGAAPLRRTLPAALRDVGSASAATRASAIADLVDHAAADRQRVVSALERALSDDVAPVRAAAAVALADVGGVEALPALLVAVEDDDAHVRQMAITAIGEIGDARARERLRRALTDDRPEVRFQAVIAFSRVAPDEAMEAIVAASSDPDPSIRYIAIRCAEERAIEGERALPEAWLGRATSLIEDPDAAVRVAAAIVLARSGEHRAEPVLLDVVRGALSTHEAEDEAACVELCGELGIAAAEPYLARRAFGVLGFAEGKFAWQALVSLARLGNARARSKIVRDLGSWWRDRRTLAVAAAGRARLAEARPLIEAMSGNERLADADAVALALRQLGARPPDDAPPSGAAQEASS